MEVRHNPPIDEPLERALVALWVRVTNAGGAVGFVAPVDGAAVAPLARAELARVRSGDDELVVGFDGDAPVGFGFLSPGASAVSRHLGTIRRLQRDPAAAGRGVGTALLAELEAAAWARGLERVALTARGGTGVERFYLSRGYRVDGILPGRLRLADGRSVEELHMSKTRPGAPDARLPLRIRALDPDLPLPAYAHPDDAGLDLRAREAVSLYPGERAVVPTGVAVEVPPGHVGLVHPRSGLAARHGLALVNAPGTIDAGYRGEVKVILVNLGDEAVTLERGDRVAQLLVQRVERPEPVAVAELTPSPRGDGGFGSTGR